MSYADHDHRGEYASDSHDHYDYAERHHRHYDEESTVRGLREDLGHAEERIRSLEDDLRGALASLRVLDRLRPTCVICLDATADRQTTRGPACSDCVGEPEDHADEDEPYCYACGGPVGIFLGHGDGWHHWRGNGTAGPPVELFDAGHAPEVAWRPAGAQ